MSRGPWARALEPPTAALRGPHRGAYYFLYPCAAQISVPRPTSPVPWTSAGSCSISYPSHEIDD